MSELTVILKDESRTYRQKFLIYDLYSILHQDPKILECIELAKKNFEGEPDDIIIRINFVFQ